MKIRIINTFAAFLITGLLLSACTTGSSKRATEKTLLTQKIVSTNVRLATIYLQRNQINIAIEKAERALEANSKSSQANSMMALIRWRLKEYKVAEKYFRRAIRFQANNSIALNNYGAFLCDMGKIDRSLQYFDRAVENPLYRNRSQALTNAGRCLIKKPDAKKAEAYFRRALKFNRRESEALFQLAKISYKSKRMLTARGFMQRYLETGRKTAESLYLALRIENAMGNKQDAMQFARQLKREYPASTEASRVKVR